MSRDWRMFVEDMLHSAATARQYAAGLTFDELRRHGLPYDGIIRHLTIIGEAAKSVPQDVQQRWAQVPWKRIVRFRDLATHHYFGLDDAVVWDILHNHLEALESDLRALLTHETEL